MMPSPKPSDLGLDALDILPGGEIAFSTEVDLFSETLGPLQHGDLLSDQDRVVRSLTDLIAPFDPMPPIADPGLDAVQVLDSGEVWFSVETEFFSQQLGVTIQRGDLLSSAGRIVKTGQELLARFHPPPIPTDFGLDAFHLWPGGEVWFSLEEGFDDSVLGHIGSGDLLSDSGEVVYRNLELLRGFQPLEKMADFGLDALYIVSDAQAQTLAGGRCMQTHLDPATGDLTMSWETKGRLHQLEKAVSVEGPWLPLGPITSELLFTDPGAITSGPQAFYRLREW
jgi:hypothetical protein